MGGGGDGVRGVQLVLFVSEGVLYSGSLRAFLQIGVLYPDPLSHTRRERGTLRLHSYFVSTRPGMGSSGTGTLGNKCISRKPLVATGAAHRTALPITCRTSD